MEFYEDEFKDENYQSEDQSEASEEARLMRFFKVLGIWLYVLAFIVNIWLHIIILHVVSDAHRNSTFFWLFYVWSFIAFTHATVFLFEFIFSVLPPVVDILNGTRKVNNDMYMNALCTDYAADQLSNVTISIPVYMEENGVIFETVYRSKLAAEDYTKQTGRKCNVVVSDDGIGVMLKKGPSIAELEDKIKEYSKSGNITGVEMGSDIFRVVERVYFYRKVGVGFVVRPAENRPGIFKKSSNLNYTLRMGKEVDEGKTIEELVADGAAFSGGYAEGNIHTSSLILLIDKDSGLHPEIISAIAPEFTRNDKLAYIQCATNASNMEDNFFARLSGRQVNNNNQNVFPCMALKGIFVPLVGHNVFIRKSALASLGYWHEHRVSEDFDLAIRLYARGWHGKYAQVHGLEFTEYASRTYSEDAMKEYRYTYGLLEMFFSGTIEWGKTRTYDAFYMIIYFIARINNAVLLPYIAIITITGDLDLMFWGYMLCCIVFIVLPSLRTILLGGSIKKEYLFRISESFLLFFTFAGCTFPAGAGSVRYFMNVVTKSEHAFPATSVSTLVYSFKEGVKFIYKYFLKNKGVLVVSLFCLERIQHIILYSKGFTGPEIASIFELAQIAFAPIFLTPQLFFRKKNGVIVRRESTNMLQCLHASAFFREAGTYIAEHPDESLFLYAIEIDKFHIFNLWYGHEEGDAYSNAIGTHLADVVEKFGGIPGHIAGGNFICLLPNGDALLNEVQRELSDYVKTSAQLTGFYPIIGVYSISDKSIPVDVMYDRALLALDNLRGNLTERSIQYDPDMDKKLDEEVKMLADVRKGIENDEFMFYVQPRCDIRNHKVVGGEALVRWKHRDEGLISPGRFVPILEKSGLTLIVDQIIWEKVIAWQGKRIKDGLGIIPVSVNVSRADILSIDVSDKLNSLCEKYGVPRSAVMLEITEGTFDGNNKEIRNIARQLAEEGYPVIMDGFGSGYSSLSVMQELDFNMMTFNLKVLNNDDNGLSRGHKIIKSVVESSKLMEVPMIIKTVENAEQEEFLLKNGCRYAQGFYYYKPMPVDEFNKLMTEEDKIEYGGYTASEEDIIDQKDYKDKLLGISGVVVRKDGDLTTENLDERLSEIISKDVSDTKMIYTGMDEIISDAANDPESYAMGIIYIRTIVGTSIPFLMRAIYMNEHEEGEKFFCTFTDMSRFKKRNMEAW